MNEEQIYKTKKSIGDGKFDLSKVAQGIHRV